MTTQWNPAQAYRAPHAADHQPDGEERESAPTGSGPWNDERPDTGGAAPTESGPWRGYTMPVPEHPDHADTSGEPAHDGISGYPDPTEGAASEAGRGGEAGAREPAADRERPEPARRPGRHARPSSRSARAHAAAAAREARAAQEGGEAEGTARSQGTPEHEVKPPGATQGAAKAEAPAKPQGADADHRAARAPAAARQDADRAEDTGHDDDPEGLAGWVGSLAEAAEDAQIAGRTTGSFPIVAPQAAGGAPRSVRDAHDDEDETSSDATGPRPRRRTMAETAARDTADDPAEDAGADADPSAPEPLPRRVPGPSAVSGAFRAVGPETAAPSAGTDDGDQDGSSTRAEARPARTPEEDADGDSSAAQEDEEYRPTTHDHWRSTSSITRAELVERLDALSTLTELGQDDLPEELVARSGQLLDHAGARLRLSAEHTVVALAGGTGSGKSSLFNALCGLELSQTGVTRPTTSKAHACVWGHEGADALLSWLGVPNRYRHSRTSVLDAGNSELTGLVLLDLPDHDSVRSMHTAEADRLIGSVDLLVWVLDPQKYADAAVHHRYLAQMSGHGAVTIAVLNQVDKVAPDELEELLTDLRRLLESESGVHPRVITTSTITDQGIRDLREFLAETVGERRALVDRLAADLDQVIEPFGEFRGDAPIPEGVPADTRRRIESGLADAAGVSAVADVVETNDVRRGRRQVGWPVARHSAKLRKDPLAAVQLDFLRRDGEQGVSGPVDAHEAELETVLGDAADAVSEDMPGPWRRRMRAAARSAMSDLPAELGEGVSGAVGDPGQSPAWWKAARVAQFALLAAAGLGLAWVVVSLVSWLGGGFTGLRMFDDPVFLAYAGALVAASLFVGWLTGVGCGNLVEVAAVQRREEVERAALARVKEIAGTRVVEPMEAELGRYRAFRAAYEVAARSE
ncbi:GTPase [Nocardiopsis aegyptia]|uniref:GTP-binding protein EngB required for normal cell division n=1 Tax=Nocardiopsis aegyptia TaxID=220378 RepID=A0A7Z0ET30_9ACTN|nr:GTPase [Nocardiopsis aegyptia]NYJ36805.1 GTP-binding protein EngB required for normal cell division [Nocardiopsis aegyptia]